MGGLQVTINIADCLRIVESLAVGGDEVSRGMFSAAACKSYRSFHGARSFMTTGTNHSKIRSNGHANIVDGLAGR